MFDILPSFIFDIRLSFNILCFWAVTVLFSALIFEGGHIKRPPRLSFLTFCHHHLSLIQSLIYLWKLDLFGTFLLLMVKLWLCLKLWVLNQVWWQCCISFVEILLSDGGMGWLVPLVLPLFGFVKVSSQVWSLLIGYHRVIFVDLITRETSLNMTVFWGDGRCYWWFRVILTHFWASSYCLSYCFVSLSAGVVYIDGVIFLERSLICHVHFLILL